jgi:hypothetical protein
MSHQISHSQVAHISCDSPRKREPCNWQLQGTCQISCTLLLPRSCTSHILLLPSFDSTHTLLSHSCMSHSLLHLTSSHSRWDELVVIKGGERAPDD